MLVLTRKQKESIKIGDDITITILRVQGGAVKVGIEAPNQVRVLRGELTPNEPTYDTNSSDMEPQVIQFRFSPDVPDINAPAKSDRTSRRSNDRGPLASLMASLHTTGVIETSSP